MLSTHADDGLAYRLRGPKHIEGEVTERRAYRGGTIDVVQMLPNRPRVRATVTFRATPARAGKAAHDFSTNADAMRWIDENEIGGNPTGFLHEIAGRRFRR